jgi:hypothetical protein
MSQTYHVTGELTDNQHVRLDEPIPLTTGRVRLVVEKLSNDPQADLVAFERLLRERQAARGHVPPSKEQVDAYLNSERASWDS